LASSISVGWALHTYPVFGRREDKDRHEENDGYEIIKQKKADRLSGGQKMMGTRTWRR